MQADRVRIRRPTPPRPARRALPLLARLLLGLLLLGLLPLGLAPDAHAQPVPLAEPVSPGAARAAALPTLITVRYGEGVTFRSERSPMTVNLRVRAQLRFTQLQELDEAAAHAEEMQIRRARVLVRGRMFRDDLDYYVQLGFSNLDMEPDRPVPLRDARITWRAHRDLALRVGQMKVPFALQRRTSSGYQQFVDRSLTTGEFNLDRDVGAVLRSDDLFGFGGRLGYELGIFGGDGRNRTSDAPGVLWVARAVVRPFGGFLETSEADHERSLRPKLAIGAAVAHNDNTRRARSTFTNLYAFSRFDYDHAEVDVQLKWRGFSLVAEWMARRADRAVATDPDDASREEFSRSGWGWYAQAAYLFLPTWELGGRYATVQPMGADRSNLVQASEAGGVLSWYLREHDFKVPLDAFHVRSEGKTDALRVRVQTQMWF